MKRALLTDAVAVVGFGSLVGGVAQVHGPSAWIVAGVLLLALWVKAVAK